MAATARITTRTQFVWQELRTVRLLTPLVFNVFLYGTQRTSETQQSADIA
jgi:hypothetical protein